MNADVNPSTAATNSNRTRRSRQSMEFETLWRNLPKEGLMPHRRDFNPARAASLLRYVMLVEMRLEDTASFPVRLAGSAVIERIQRDVKGHDYLEFMHAEHHAGVIETARLMLNQPCGLWQITPLRFDRGLAFNFEVTAFPLLGEPAPFTLALMVPRDELIRPISPGDRLMLADTATEFEFLDIGAGAPDWQPL